MSVLAATSNIWVLGGFFAACVLLFIVPGVLFAKFVVDACVRDKHYDAAVGEVQRFLELTGRYREGLDRAPPGSINGALDAKHAARLELWPRLSSSLKQ
jgi:hypothetical protein